MFQPETEDMLPRTAPKPSAGLTEGAPKIQPTVPEVSILFGQPGAHQQLTPPPQQQHAQAIQPPQSYASWKKQVLPKVTYPPGAVSNPEAAAPTVASNLYPLRVQAPPITDQMNYRRSLESLQAQQHHAAYAQPVLPQTPPQAHDMYSQQALTHRRSLDAMAMESQQRNTPPYAPRQQQQQSDILTICAGTQTDPMLSEGFMPSAQQQQYASKQDVLRLQESLDEVRAMQMRLLQICESLLVPAPPPRDDKGVQCNLAGSNGPHVDSPFQPQSSGQPLKATPPAYLTPRATRPQAQSTTYRPNTPVRSESPKPTGSQPLQRALPKPATEKSLVMNELALKYLPNEKLTELLNELNISPRPRSPQPRLADPKERGAGSNKENLEKGPSDISNASYKYLKKYRLLPEEQGGHQYHHQPGSPQSSPLAARRTAADQPYALPCIPENMLNLEHIRNQPKFL